MKPGVRLRHVRHFIGGLFTYQDRRHRKRIAIIEGRQYGDGRREAIDIMGGLHDLKPRPALFTAERAFVPPRKQRSW